MFQETFKGIHIFLQPRKELLEFLKNWWNGLHIENYCIH